MKLAYFDCFSGAAGDMIVGACLDAGAPVEPLRATLAKLPLSESVELRIEKVQKNSLAATGFEPFVGGKTAHRHDHDAPAESTHHHTHGHEHHHPHPHDHKHAYPHKHPHPDQADAPPAEPDSPAGHRHHHRDLRTISQIIRDANLSARVTDQSLAVFQRLAEAEAKVHGTDPRHIHFHEVGAVDAIMDIVGACAALELLQIDKVVCSPLVTGSGTVKCAHGILPVPAPATSELIRNVPVTAGHARVELLTPTGAAILTTLADSFGPLPPMTLHQIGYGAGHYDHPDTANVLRLLIGTQPLPPEQADHDEIVILEANIDDATGELIGHVMNECLAAGALDVYCTPILMKHNRPATCLSVLCRSEQESQLAHLIFTQSTTFGIRRRTSRRMTLPRQIITADTRFGPIRVKIGKLDGQVITRSVEFQDCQQAARTAKVTVKEVIQAALHALES